MMLAYMSHIRNLRTVATMIASGIEPTAAILAAAVDVTPRHVHRYLATLRELGAPLPVDQSRIGYRFAKKWDFDAALVRWLKK